MKSPDITIIGGGIVGCACAYYLSKAGMRVLVVEKGGIGSGASSAGMSHIVTWEEPEAHLLLARASQRLYMELCQALVDETGVDIEYRRTGSIAVVEESAGMQSMQAMISRLSVWGVDCKLLDEQDLRRMEPNLSHGLLGGAHFPNDGMVNPLLTTQALMRAASALGAEFRTFAEVTEIERRANGKITGLRVANEKIATEKLLVAAGAWSGQVSEMAGLRIPVEPRKGVLAITAAVPENTMTCKVILSAGYMDSIHSANTGGSAGAAAVAANIQQVKNGNLLLGSTRQFAGFDNEVDIDLARAMLARCVRFLPVLRKIPLLRMWTGLRPYTPDLLPIIGPTESIPGLYFATGHEGIGITEAPVTGWLISKMMLAESTDLPVERLSPDRFLQPAG